VIGSYPDSDIPLLTLDHAAAWGRAVVFFGHGLDRSSIGPDALQILDDTGTPVPAEVSIFRGDDWPNVLTARPLDDWKPGTSYKLVVKKSLRTLHGISPSADIELSFISPCTTGDTSPSCVKPPAERPPSLCPVTDARHVEPPDGEGEGAGGAAGEGGAAGAGGLAGMAGQTGFTGPGGTSSSGSGSGSGSGGAAAAGTATAGGTSGTPAGAAPAANGVSDDGGCGISGPSTASSTALVAMGMLAFSRRWRRRRRRE
jgi:hypothetical protein